MFVLTYFGELKKMYGKIIIRNISSIFLILSILSTAVYAKPDKNNSCANSSGHSANCNTSPVNNTNTATPWHVTNSDPAITDTAYTGKEDGDVDSTATTSFTNAPYLFVTSNTNQGAQTLAIEVDTVSGDLSNPSVVRTFTVGANADHQITISFDAVKNASGKCVPVFDAEGTTEINGEADAIAGLITLKVGDIELFKADATSNITSATNTALAEVTTVDCASIAAGTVGTATAVIVNPVASTTSIVYSLTVQAYGEDGSLIFDSNSTINAGDAPAGAYDNDILIAVGLTNTYANTTTDAYASNGDF